MRCALIAIVILTTPLLADQTPAKRSPEQTRASHEAHRGDWEFTANSQQYGKFRGYWSAVRIGDGADTLDEFLVLGSWLRSSANQEPRTIVDVLRSSTSFA